ncbi:MAG: hypothetical protein ACT6QS_11865 [Flavobacteriales bacterium]
MTPVFHLKPSRAYGFFMLFSVGCFALISILFVFCTVLPWTGNRIAENDRAAISLLFIVLTGLSAWFTRFLWLLGRKTNAGIRFYEEHLEWYTSGRNVRNFAYTDVIMHVEEVEEPVSSGVRSYVNRWIRIRIFSSAGEELCMGSQPIRNKAEVARMISITGPYLRISTESMPFQLPELSTRRTV